jgi:hypothetical protein
VSLGPISNACTIPINNTAGNLPNVSEGLSSWFQQVTFIRITKMITNGDLFESETPFVFFGVVQPTVQNLRMLPEGQRSWLYKTVYALPGLVLTTDDVVMYAGVRYRVTGKTDYTQFGYVDYSLCQDFTRGHL